MAYSPQQVTLARYEAKTLRVTMSPATDVTGWTFQLTIRSAGTAVLTVTNASFTITDAANGIFTVPLTSTQTGTLAAGAVYDFDIWRTNSGSEAQLVYGNVQVNPQQYQTGG